MKKLLIVALILTSVTTFGFNVTETKGPGTISGVVLDKTLQAPIPFVTVVVKTLSGEVVTGAITNDVGVFEIADIPKGKSMVYIQFIGYKTHATQIEVTQEHKYIQLGTILLEEDVAALEEVVVVAERTTIEQKIDRKVINVGKDLTTAGSTAADIMNNLPSVRMDQQTGAISLRGNENVRVMVDGKLSNVPVAQLLKQIPSTSIKQIELITNPSAKYNPEGMSGLINIILRKNTNIGFNGDASVGLKYEKNAEFNGALNLNYRNGKFNFYGNYGNNVEKSENLGNIFRPGNNSNQYLTILESDKSNLFKAGVDFYLNDKNTLSFFTNQNIYEEDTDITIAIKYNDNPSLNQSQRIFGFNEDVSSQYNFDYKLKFEKEGHNIELEADYNLYSSDENARSLFSGTTQIPNYRDFSDTDRDRLSLNLDYVNPINKNTKLEVGIETQLFTTTIGYNSTGLSYNSSGNLEPTPNTDFNYNRNIYSAYATFGKTHEKWSYQIGARIENVEIKADTNAVRAFTNDYLQVYPSAFVTYTPSEKNQYQISYSRRVDRPGINQVNPIREFATPLISSYGNTNLEPQFTNSLETNFTRNLEHGSITAGVFYRAIENEIQQVIYIDRTNLERSILTHDNFENSSAYGLELSGNYKPIKWWSLNASFELYSQTEKGIAEVLNNYNNNPTIDDIEIKTVTAENTSFSARLNNNFSVTKDLNLSAFGMYRGKYKGIQFESEPMYFVNIGARYDLWEGRGTFSINYNDIFDTMKAQFKGATPYEQIGEFNWESNTIYVGLSYRFGGGEYKAKSRKRRDDNLKSGGGIF